MRKSWSFQKRISFGLIGALTAASVICLVSLYALSQVTGETRSVVLGDVEVLNAAELLSSKTNRATAAGRGFLLTGEKVFLSRMKTADSDVNHILSSLEERGFRGQERALFESVRDREALYFKGLNEVVLLKMGKQRPNLIIQDFESTLQQRRDELDIALADFRELNQTQFRQGKDELASATSQAVSLISAVGIACIALAAILGFFLVRVLTSLYQDAQNAAKARDELMSVVSHDLKNPVSAIKLSASLARRQLKRISSGSQPEPEDLRAKLEQSLDRISRSSDLMEKLIGDLLDLGRLEAGQPVMEKETVDLLDLVAEMKSDMSPIAAQNAIEIRLLAPSTPFLVTCDPLRVRQVLTNLIGNAIKYSPPGESVLVEMAEDEREAFIRVEDHGPGIPQDQIPVIFDRYRQARPSDARIGSGLGLAIARGWVKAHGGRIWVESTSSRGTTFCFTIPKAGDSVQAASA